MSKNQDQSSKEHTPTVAISVEALTELVSRLDVAMNGEAGGDPDATLADLIAQFESSMQALKAKTSFIPKALADEVKSIATQSCLPDGDHVNTPTALWAEDWFKRYEALGVRAALPGVEGDLLPPIDSKVFIHLASQDEWVEHTVVGYYVWGSGVGNLYRVFVRVADSGGILNARALYGVQAQKPIIDKPAELTPQTMVKGAPYNWKHAPEDKLIYLGRNWSGNGYWHQFEKIGDPRTVWCEVTDSDLARFEETKE